MSSSAALLVLLVGELTAPYRPLLERALPQVFQAPVPEVALGVEAPPGRTVAWVTAKDDEVELVLHTARVPGDLRRVLKFAPSDPPEERAKTIAFGLSVMVREREAALAVALPPPATASWFFGARGAFAFDTGAKAPGGGGFIEGHRVLGRASMFRFDAGVGLEFTAQAETRSTSLLAPAAWAELRLGLGDARVVPRLSVGAGATFLRTERSNTTALHTLPLFRTALDVEVKLVDVHRLVVGAAAHFTTSSLPLGTGMGMGMGDTAALGPLWVRGELGYAVAF